MRTYFSPNYYFYSYLYFPNASLCCSDIAVPRFQLKFSRVCFTHTCILFIIMCDFLSLILARTTFLYHVFNSQLIRFKKYQHCVGTSIYLIPRFVLYCTAAFHARDRGSVPGLGGLKETKMFLPIHV